MSYSLFFAPDCRWWRRWRWRRHCYWPWADPKSVGVVGDSPQLNAWQPTKNVRQIPWGSTGCPSGWSWDVVRKVKDWHSLIVVSSDNASVGNPIRKPVGDSWWCRWAESRWRRGPVKTVNSHDKQE